MLVDSTQLAFWVKATHQALKALHFGKRLFNLLRHVARISCASDGNIHHGAQQHTAKSLRRRRSVHRQAYQWRQRRPHDKLPAGKARQGRHVMILKGRQRRKRLTANPAWHSAAPAAKAGSF